MAGFDDNLVREYFELSGFFVRQSRKYAVQSRRKRADEASDLLVINPAPRRDTQPPFQVFGADLAGISRAAVAVKGWHTTRAVTPAMIRKGELLEFVRKEAVEAAGEAFADLGEVEGEAPGELTKILVLPGLPTAEPQRAESIALLRAAGVDHVLTFRTILESMLQRVESNQSYDKSDTLQLLRLLRVHDMVKSAQLELFPDRSGR
jgi:hypothetical protein